MSNFLFDEFEPVSAKAWKQKIQVDLKGADYNDTLLWHTDESIIVKPFYTKEDYNNTPIHLPKKGFNICQTVYIDDEKIANSIAVDALNRGANSIQFKASKPFNPKPLLKGFKSDIIIYFQLSFLDVDFQKKINEFFYSNKHFI